MIYTPLTEKAMKMAYRAHDRQADKAGVPYIFHLTHVAEQMTNEASTCAALLHEVLDDTMYKKADLSEAFPEEVVDAVCLLIQGKEDYYDYIRAIKKNPIAKEVKLVDLEHNLDESRFESARSVTEQQKSWWNEKYIRAKEILLSDN